MQLSVLDYSEVYFQLMRETAVPSRRGGKFIVARNGVQRYAVFSPQGLSTYHANIVERFLHSQGIQGTYNPKGDEFHFNSSDWDIEGGGHWEIDETKAVLRISGSSLAYGGFDEPALAAELRCARAFDGIEIVFAPG